MLFSSVTFLYYFLPAVVLLYFLTPQKWKNVLLLGASMVFYFFGEPLFLAIMVASALLGWAMTLWFSRFPKGKAQKSIFVLSVIVCLLPLLFFKYSDFFLSNLNALTSASLPLLKLRLPIGISFYTFQILSYVIDAYRQEVPVQNNPILFLTYVTFFPQLIAGPIVRYQTVAQELEHRTHSLQGVSEGTVRFCVGLGKKVLIANALGVLSTTLAGMEARSVLNFWLGAISYTFQIYFDFSGYSDMAIGLGKIFGFHFPENFRYPFVSHSITEFWRRWHISLGTWFRDYVYIPMGGNRVKRWKWLRNILVVWLLTGFWHGASWNFIAWGLLFGLLLLAEKLFLGKGLQKLPRMVGILYVMILVNFSFVIFGAVSLGDAATALWGMFGGGSAGLYDGTTLYYLRSYLGVLLVAAIGATPLPKLLVDKWSATRVEKIWGAVIQPLFAAGILVLATASLMNGTFNPFLYFRF